MKTDVSRSLPGGEVTRASESSCASNDALTIPAEACSSMPPWLSSSLFKRQLYGTDTYAIEGLEAVERVAGDEARAFCYEHSLLVVKPEAVVSRRLERIFSWLDEIGFRIVDAVPFRFSPAITRGLWRYHWNAVTAAHRQAVDLLVESGPSLAVLVRASEVNGVPASLRLAELKGHADPARRQAGQLRYELGNFNALLNHVHSPDEPIDVLRELAVVLAPQSLESLLGAARLGQELSAHQLSRGLASSLYEIAGPPPALGLADVLRELGIELEVAELDLGDLLQRSADGELALSRWQRVVLTTAYTESVRSDVRRLVPSVSLADWVEGRN
ncbi:MAG: nucleoside-diphosphate kinase [Solirubrobacterales bacterium]